MKKWLPLIPLHSLLVMNPTASTKEASPASFVIVGRLGKAYGLEGWIHVHSFTEATDNLLHYDPLYWQPSDHWQPMPITDKRWHNHGIMIQMKALVPTREAVQAFSGREIAVLRSQLPPLPKGEYYWCDLEGLTVINRQHYTLGTVDHVLNVGSSDLLVIKKAQSTIMIPQLPHYVDAIDLDTGIITVDWELDWIHDKQ